MTANPRRHHTPSAQCSLPSQGQGGERAKARRTFGSEAEAARAKRERRIERAVESAVRRRAEREARKRRDGCADGSADEVAERIRTQARSEAVRWRRMEEEAKGRNDRDTLRMSKRNKPEAKKSTKETHRSRSRGSRSRPLERQDSSRAADEPALSSWVRKHKRQDKPRKSKSCRSKSAGGSVGSIGSALRRRRARGERGGNRDDESVSTCATAASAKSSRSLSSVGRKLGKSISFRNKRCITPDPEKKAERHREPMPERTTTESPTGLRKTEVVDGKRETLPQIEREPTTKELYPSFYEEVEDGNHRGGPGALESTLALFGLCSDGTTSSSKGMFDRTPSSERPSSLEERVIQLKLEVAEAKAEEEEERHRARKLSDRNKELRSALDDSQKRTAEARTSIRKLNQEMNRVRKLKARLGPQILGRRVEVWKAARDNTPTLERNCSSLSMDGLGRMISGLEQEALLNIDS